MWLAASVVPPVAGATTDPDRHFDTLADGFAAAYRALGIPGLQLALTENLDALEAPPRLEQQRAVLGVWRSKLAEIDSDTLSVCRRIELARLRAHRDMAAARAQLGLDWLALRGENFATDAARLAAMPVGQRWYRWLVWRWLGAPVEPDELLSLGVEHLHEAQADYRRLQAAMGFADDHEAFRERLGQAQPDVDLDELFAALQARVHARLPTLYHDHRVTPARIRRSARETFAVPGWYDASSRSFHYNVLNGRFDPRQADWLFLHEATPGHHFQIRAHANSDCESRLGAFGWPGFMEGWAAYVEAQGKTLGVYARPEAELAAVEWNLVRSARVVLDVRIHRDGWTRSQAMAFWAREVYGQEAIAEREIERVERWPAQVHTYKYGAARFAQQGQAFMSRPGADVRDFHALALRYGPMPWGAFEALVAVSAAPDQRSGLPGSEPAG